MDFNNTETITNFSKTIHYPQNGAALDLTLTTFQLITDLVTLASSIPTILLNAIVILVIKQRKELQKTSNILLSSLAVTDLLVGVMLMPLSVIADILILRQVPFEHVCRLNVINLCLTILLVMATLYHLTIIAWERYVAIQKWMDYKYIITNSRLKKLAIVAWLCAFLLAITNLMIVVIGVDRRIMEGWYTVCAAVGAACLILITHFYRKVYLGIRKRKTIDIRQVTNFMKVKLESKVAKTTGLLTAALIFSFVPIFALGLLSRPFPVFGTSAAFRFTERVAQLNSLFNPLLYFYRDRRFRDALRELVRKKKPQAIQPAVKSAQFVRRKDPFGSSELHKMEKPTPYLTRSVSCLLPEVLDSIHRRPGEVMLKRSLSAPTLDKCSNLLDSVELQQPSSIVVTSATIHATQSEENDPEGTKHANKPYVSLQLIQNKSRSKS